MGNQATLVVTLFDDAGVQLSGRQISYDSSDPFAVSVSSAGVVSAHREGTARITATSEGRSDFSDVTAVLRPLEPTEDTELQGDSIELKTVVIPLGVTVTVIGNIDLIVQGVIDIAGTLQSDCGKLGLKSSSTVQISGTVQNGCATQGQGDSLKVEADGGLTLDGGTLISLGVLQLVSVLSGIGGGTGPARSVRAAGDCVIHDTELRPGREKAGVGFDGQPIEIFCHGNLGFGGNTIIVSQSGGDAADVLSSPATGPSSADADPGGSGGMIRMVVGGDILFGVDGGTTVRSGDGGAGGTATATANHPSSSATTVAGDGGDSGGVIVSAGGSISIEPGGLGLQLGLGGAGGDASALGSGGGAAEFGGAASAVAGQGGSTPDLEITATLGISGGSNAVMMGGGGGSGGSAEATGGNGGGGNAGSRDGGAGGSTTASAGRGGDALASDFSFALIGFGGDGGGATFAGGTGGVGFDGCSAGSTEPGGRGGAGGAATGGAGSGGSGLAPGAGGGAFVSVGTGNGGRGGSGAPPGAGGAAGADGIVAVNGRSDVGTTFANGQLGESCGVTPVASVLVTPSAPNILVGGEVQLGADPQDSEGASLQGRVVTWATDDAGVASVSATGLVTGASEGSATITATSEGIDGTAEVTVTPAGEPPIACGDLISGSITAAGEFHEYEFTGSTGDFITITLSESSFGTSSAHDARVTLYAPSDALVGSFDSDSQADFTLGETGTFVLRAGANDSLSTGSYSIGLECIRPASSDAVAIAYGDLISSDTMDPAEADLYTFSGSAGDFITLTLSESSFGTSSAHDARVTLYAPSDALVGSFDSDSQANFTLGETGTFVLRVNANNFVSTGSYELVLIKN